MLPAALLKKIATTNLLIGLSSACGERTSPREEGVLLQLASDLAAVEHRVNLVKLKLRMSMLVEPMEQISESILMVLACK